MDSQNIQAALELFGIREPVTHEVLQQRYRRLRATWTPHRYANLTNSPQKYMQMYKKAEAKSKEIETAYRTLLAWLNSQDPDRLTATTPDSTALLPDADEPTNPHDQPSSCAGDHGAE